MRCPNRAIAPSRTHLSFSGAPVGLALPAPECNLCRRRVSRYGSGRPRSARRSAREDSSRRDIRKWAAARHEAALLEKSTEKSTEKVWSIIYPECLYFFRTLVRKGTEFFRIKLRTLFALIFGFSISHAKGKTYKGNICSAKSFHTLLEFREMFKYIHNTNMELTFVM